MAQHGDATQFTRLGTIEPVGAGALGDLYSYPESGGRCWVRANMIASADGGATQAGTSGGLGAAGDKALFDTLRSLADVILVGAATAKTEDYSGVDYSDDERAARRSRGQAETAPIALLTRSGSVDPDAAVFRRTDVAPLVFTSAAAAAATRRRLGDLAEVVDASGDGDPESLDLAGVFDTLAARGLHRVLAEGGPGILGRLIAADLLDELCLTVAPMLVGAGAPRIVTGDDEGRRDPSPLALRHTLTDGDGYVFLRYTRSPAGH